MDHQTETESESNKGILSRFIRRCRYYGIPWRCLFIQGLVITNSLTELAAVSMLMTYLTEIRGETLINAAATVNILEFVSGILSVPASILKDYLGYHPMVFLTTQVYIMGMVFLCISASIRSTFDVTIENSSYMFENLLLYVGLYLIALGKAGSNSSCVEDFFGEQLKKNVSNKDIDEKRNRARQMFWMRASQLLGQILGTVLLTVVDVWKVYFGFCAFTMQLALGVFLIGSPPFYTTMGINVGLLQFKFFEKTATIRSITDTPPPNDVEEQERKKLKRNDEVKENKKIPLLLVPISMIFLIYGIVNSIESTFFLTQGNSMKDSGNSRILIDAITILIIVSSLSKTLHTIGIQLLLRNRLTGVRKKYATLIIIGVGLIFSIVCCATAQAVEAKRLGIIVKKGLQDNTNDDPIPMSVYWLLPQFIFIGAMNGLVGDGMESFYESELPMCMSRYASEVTQVMTGVGTLLSVGLVSIEAKASTIGGGSSWFADTVNRSHLDSYYRSLTILCIMFCFVYAYVSTAYMRKRLPRNEEEDSDKIAQPELSIEMIDIVVNLFY